MDRRGEMYTQVPLDQTGSVYGTFTIPNHGLTTGEVVKISQTSGGSHGAANGNYPVTYLTNDTFRIQYSDAKPDTLNLTATVAFPSQQLLNNVPIDQPSGQLGIMTINNHGWSVGQAIYIHSITSTVHGIVAGYTHIITAVTTNTVTITFSDSKGAISGATCSIVGPVQHIRSSYNISSINKIAQGTYDLYFATPMSDNKYSIVGTGSMRTSHTGALFADVISCYPLTTTKARVSVASTDQSTQADNPYFSVQVFGN